MGEKILIVDDDARVLQTFARSLTQAGYTVLTAAGGQEALRLHERERPDIALVDMRMPHMDGFAVLQAIREWDSEAEVLLVTGHGDMDTAIAALRAGASDFIPKPVKQVALDTALRRAQERLRLKRELGATQEALRASEEYYRAITETAFVGVAIADPDENLLFVNQAFTEMLGYTRGELVGMNLSQLTTPEEFAKYREQTQRRKAGLRDQYETALRRKDGTMLNALVSAAPLRDVREPPLASTCTERKPPQRGEWPARAGGSNEVDGRFKGTLAVITDITERVRAEEEVQRRTAQLEALREVGLELTAQLDLDVLLRSIASRAMELLGGTGSGLCLYRPERDVLEVVTAVGDAAVPVGSIFRRGEGLSGKVWESGEPLVVDNYQHWDGRAAAYGGFPIAAVVGVPVRWRAADAGEGATNVVGTLVVRAEASRTFSLADAELLSLLATQAAIAVRNARLHQEVLDHAEQLEQRVRERTAEIQAQYAHLEAILRSVGDAILMTDREMRIRYVNPAFIILTGYTAEEVLGQYAGFVGVGAMSEQVEGAIQLALAKGEVWQGEVTARRKDGRTYDAALTVASVRDANGDLAGYVSSHRDISRLKELDQARNQFITSVSHQLRTPAANIKLYAQLLRMGRQPKRAEHYLQVLEQQVDQLTCLVQDILEMTALDSGQAVVTWEPVLWPIVVKDAITRYQSQAEASGLTLVATPVPPDLPTVKGDPPRLSQALGELLENALIFTPADGQVTIEVGSIEKDAQRWVTVAVHDTGPGISTEEQERVFGRFYRGSLAESGHVPGTGLGLSIADEILRAHGGQVTVESPSTWLRTGPSTRLRAGPSTRLRAGPSTRLGAGPSTRLRAGEVGQGSTFTLWLPLSEGHG